MSQPSSPLDAGVTEAASARTVAASHLSGRTVTRIWCGLIFAACAAMLSVGLYLHPAADGLGTHEELGFPPCGMMVYVGLPCPTCGCTTAVTYLAHGNLPAAFVTQPFGALVGVLGFVGVALGGLGLVTGRWFGPSLTRVNFYATHILVVSLLILLGAWAYKIYAVLHHIHW